MEVKSFLNYNGLINLMGIFPKYSVPTPYPLYIFTLGTFESLYLDTLKIISGHYIAKRPKGDVGSISSQEPN